MIRPWRLAPACCLAVLALILGTLRVAAQDDPAHSASARTLFEEGVQLAEHGQWRDATDRFRRALSLRDSAVIRFNLASALTELDQVVEASELFRELLRTPGVDAAVQAQAQERLAQATPRIAKLEVQVANAVAGSHVELDGRPLPPALVGVAMPVDPAKHSARLVRDGRELAVEELELGPGESGTVTLAATVPSPEQTAERAVHRPSTLVLTKVGPGPRQDSSDTSKRKKRMWWGLGSGAVALIAGAVIAGVLLAQRSPQADPYTGDFEPGSVSVKVNP